MPFLLPRDSAIFKKNGSVDKRTNVWVCKWMKKVCAKWTIISTKDSSLLNPDPVQMELWSSFQWLNIFQTNMANTFFFFRRKCVHLWLSLEHPVLSRTTGSLGDYRIEPIIAPPRSEKTRTQAKASKGASHVAAFRKTWDFWFLWLLRIGPTVSDLPNLPNLPFFLELPPQTHEAMLPANCSFSLQKAPSVFCQFCHPEPSPCLDFGGNLRPSFRIEKPR